MKTKQLMLSTACLLAAVVSCNKNNVQQAAPVEEELVDVQVNIQTEAITKASDVTEQNFEKSVKEFDLIVFDNATGKLSQLKSTMNGNNFTTKMIPGTKKIIAVANGGTTFASSHVSTFTGLDGVYYNFSAANVSDNKLAMTDLRGLETTTTISAEQTNVVNIQLKRQACRVRLKAIMPSFLAETVTSLSYNAAYLQNIPGRFSLDGTIDDGVDNRKNILGNDLTAQTAEGGALTYKSLTTGSANLLGTPVYLYCYPGASVHLGLSVKVNGTDYFYAIPMKNLESNKSYDVEVILQNLGGTTITDPAVNTGVSANIEILPWTAGSTLTETL